MPNLSTDPGLFAANFDQRPFYVAHTLAGHPLLQLPALAALADRLPAKLLEWHSNESGAFTKPGLKQPAALSCAETILAIGERAAWVLLLQIEHDPLYRKLLDELLDEIAPLSEPVRPGMFQRQGFLFVSSRAAVTPYHFDPEHNFLLQIRGRKTVCMWDPRNRFALPAAAIDRYYAGLDAGGEAAYGNRNLLWRDEFMASAWQLPLEPGQGLHFPLHAPHTVRTESDVSISLSVTFRSRRARFRAMVHGANGRLRALGIEPPPPGRSLLWDATANFGYRAVRKGGAMLQRVRRRIAS